MLTADKLLQRWSLAQDHKLACTLEVQPENLGEAVANCVSERLTQLGINAAQKPRHLGEEVTQSIKAHSADAIKGGQETVAVRSTALVMACSLLLLLAMPRLSN